MTTPTNPIPEFTEAEVLDCLGSYNADTRLSALAAFWLSQPKEPRP